MKDKFLSKTSNLIYSKYNYDNDTKERIEYGLSIIYINITKVSVIFLIAILFNQFKTTLYFTIFLNIIRAFSYGMHAKNSFQCYILSTLLLVILPRLFLLLSITNIQKLILSFLSLLSIIVYAPSDTHKRPLVNKEKRIKLKIYSILTCCIYIGLIFLTKEEYYSKLLLLSIIIQALLINPIIYKLFKLPYNNYKEYLKSSV